MKQRTVIPSSGYYKVAASTSDHLSVRVYKDRVRLNTRYAGDGVVGAAHEWVGHLQEGDLIEAEGETLTLVVTPHDPAQAQAQPQADRRPVEAVTITAAEALHIADPLGS